MSTGWGQRLVSRFESGTIRLMQTQRVTAAAGKSNDTKHFGLSEIVQRALHSW